ncbi:MAG: PEP-CTERM sorting domain-containing protein [Phycisphaerales bacterium]|nr:MAG: PEP-CTERM sorting domain-containing protein [Phycisphaerales bacterium]
MRRALVPLAVLLVVAWGSGVALATPLITSMASNIGSGKYYDATLQEWQWNDVLVTGGSIVTEPFGFYYFNGTADWTSGLYADTSGPPLWAEGRANASFLGAGTLSMTGTFYSMSDSDIYTGLLFQAHVAAWELLESAVDSDSLDTVFSVEITPQSGYLVNDPANTYAVMQDIYEFELSFPAAAQEDGGPLPVTDFQLDIWATAGSQWIMAHQVPEPGTLLIVALGFVGLMARRRN